MTADCAENPIDQGSKPGSGTNAPIAHKGIIVQGGLQAIGPKQDDTRAKTSNCSRKKTKA
jgi:hypothetical protein